MDTREQTAADLTPEAAAQATRRERARKRQVVIVSGALTVLVMAAVVALGWKGTGGPDPHDSDGQLVRGPGQPVKRPAAPSPGAQLPVDPDCPSDTENPARMVFDLPPSGLDFGRVKQGVRLEREVAFRNEGTGTLCIRRVESGCGCIKARLVGDERRYGAGESGTIRISLNTLGREGSQKKTIQVYTNAVDVPILRFMVRAKVDLGLRFSPARIRFGRVTAGQPAEAHLRLRTPRDDKDWTVEALEGTRPVDGAPVKYEWSIEEISDARDRVLEVKIRHPGLARSGPVFDDKIVVRTTHPDRPQFTVDASMAIVEAITAVPRRASLGFVPNNIPARVWLRRIDKSEFEITRMSFERTDGKPIPDGESGFLATPGREAAGETWVEVRYDDGTTRPPGPLRAILVLRTDHPSVPEIRVECWANVRAE